MTDEELQWLFRIADRNGDGKIGRDEILFALQAWHGYQHMGQFDALFTKSRAPAYLQQYPEDSRTPLNISRTLHSPDHLAAIEPLQYLHWATLTQCSTFLIIHAPSIPNRFT